MTHLLATCPTLLAEWKACNDFARLACKGRGVCHNHAHMQQVTETALLIATMENNNNNNIVANSSNDESNLSFLRRIIHVAMLHDVADHKYESTPGELTGKVTNFIKTQFEQKDVEEHELCWNTIEAISFSKEKKNGKGWFNSTLPPEWRVVRNIVSDADKLTAIGIEGLTRCWIYGMELIEKAGKPAHMTPEWNTQRVIEHADEKLLRLKDEYIVTKSGKFLAESRHQDMVDILEKWKRGEDLPKGFDAPMYW